MENKTIMIFSSLIVGFVSLGVIYFVSSDFSTTEDEEKSSSFLSFLFQRNKNEEQQRFFTRIESFDDTVHPYHDILANNRYEELLAYIKSQCPPDTQSLGTQMYEQLRLSARISDKIMDQTLAVRVLLSAEKFEKIRAQRYMLKQLPMHDYCVQKYAYVLYQQRLSEVHMIFALNSGILWNQNQSTSTAVVDQKRAILTYIKSRDEEKVASVLPIEYEHGSAEDDNFSVQDTQNLLRELSSSEKELADLFIAIAKTKIFKNLALLQAEGVLSVQDSVRIISDIDLIIPESCYNRDAHYVFLEKGTPLDPEHEHNYKYNTQKHVMSYDISPQVAYAGISVYAYKNMELLGPNIIYKEGKVIKFAGLRFSIPICGNYKNLIEFSDRLEYIILHELGHYYMHRVDPDPSVYTSLCWATNEDLSCDKDLLVTEYAATSSVEEYAETFAHVVYEKLYGYFPYGLVSLEKKNYFLQRFGSYDH